MSHTTIAAIATPPGLGGVGIIRISGKKVPEIAQQIISHLPKPRFAHLCQITDQNHEIIDEAIALYFKAPHSFTGEDVLEIQAHGSPVVLNRILNLVIECGAVLAKPGEFSLRAFLNDKIDLLQAEAIADLINAQSEMAAKAAQKTLQGDFSKKINQLVEIITKLRVYVEASLDFAEEEIDFLADESILKDLEKIISQLQQVKQAAMQGRVLREGLSVAIIGRPNAGKSSLLNALSGQDSAIVTEIPGTTRDILREFIDIDGLPLHVIDTAGIRQTEDIVEREGLRRAYAAAELADLIILMRDSTTDVNQKFDAEINLKNKKIIFVNNKIDLLDKLPAIDENTVNLSLKNNFGLDDLKQKIKAKVNLDFQPEGLFIAKARHIDALDQAADFLQQALNQLQQQTTSELLAEDLKQAQLALSAITGAFTTDDLLGKIFSSFCVGK